MISARAFPEEPGEASGGGVAGPCEEEQVGGKQCVRRRERLEVCKGVGGPQCRLIELFRGQRHTRLDIEKLRVLVY